MAKVYKTKYHPKSGTWSKRRLCHLDTQFIGRALEHAGQFVSKWSIAMKYQGLSKKDSEKAHDAEWHKRHHVNTRIRNMTAATQDIGTALMKGKYDKAVDIAKDILLVRLPTKAEWDQPHGEWKAPEWDRMDWDCPDKG